MKFKFELIICLNNLFVSNIYNFIESMKCFYEVTIKLGINFFVSFQFLNSLKIF